LADEENENLLQKEDKLELNVEDNKEYPHFQSTSIHKI
jgi:hypothetical protein